MATPLLCENLHGDPTLIASASFVLAQVAKCPVAGIHWNKNGPTPSTSRPDGLDAVGWGPRNQIPAGSRLFVRCSFLHLQDCKDIEFTIIGKREQALLHGTNDAAPNLHWYIC